MEESHPLQHPKEALMIALSILGVAALAIGTVNTTRLVATDGLHRVATIQRF